MNIEFSVPARDAARLRGAVAGGQRLSSLALHLRLPDGRMDQSIGHLVFTGNQISPNTDSLNFVGRIPNPIVNPAKESRVGGRELISGEFVTVLLRSNVVKHGIVVPRGAVLADQLGNYVLTIGPENKVERQPVTLAASTPAKGTISAGVAPGTKIIVSGIQKVHPGLIVKPVPASESRD
jgi:membrane fusion protein (multidrug efflux system)